MEADRVGVRESGVSVGSFRVEAGLIGMGAMPYFISLLEPQAPTLPSRVRGIL